MPAQAGGASGRAGGQRARTGRKQTEAHIPPWRAINRGYHPPGHLEGSVSSIFRRFGPHTALARAVRPDRWRRRVYTRLELARAKQPGGKGVRRREFSATPTSSPTKREKLAKVRKIDKDTYTCVYVRVKVRYLRQVRIVFHTSFFQILDLKTPSYRRKPPPVVKKASQKQEVRCITEFVGCHPPGPVRLPKYITMFRRAGTRPHSKHCET